MARIVLACSLVALLGVGGMLLSSDISAGQVVENPAQSLVQPVSGQEVASTSLQGVQLDMDQDEAGGSLMVNSAYLLVALVLMTLVLLATHYRKQPTATSDGDKMAGQPAKP